MKRVLAPLAIAALGMGSACEEAKPTVARVESGGAAFEMTLPPGWSLDLAQGEGVAFASLDSFADDVECSVHFYAVPLAHDAYVAGMQRSLGGRAPFVASSFLSAGIGTFRGTRFEAQLPLDGPLGALASLAGTPHAEVYLGGPAATPIGAIVVTFGADAKATRDRMREKCLGAIQSLRVAR